MSIFLIEITVLFVIIFVIIIHYISNSYNMSFRDRAIVHIAKFLTEDGISYVHNWWSRNLWKRSQHFQDFCWIIPEVSLVTCQFYFKKWWGKKIYFLERLFIYKTGHLVTWKHVEIVSWNWVHAAFLYLGYHTGCQLSC